MPNNDNMPRGKYGDAEIPAAELAKAMEDANAFFAQGQDMYKKMEKSYESVAQTLKEQGT